MIVVDTNIISYFYFESKYSELAKNLFQKDSDLVVPLLWRSEFRNVLFLYLRKNLISFFESVEIFETAQNFFKGNEYEVSSFQVLKLAKLSECSSYDCEFVVLAKDLNIPLITQDKKILKNFPEIAFSLEQFLKTD